MYIQQIFQLNSFYVHNIHIQDSEDKQIPRLSMVQLHYYSTLVKTICTLFLRCSHQLSDTFRQFYNLLYTKGVVSQLESAQWTTRRPQSGCRESCQIRLRVNLPWWPFWRLVGSGRISVFLVNMCHFPINQNVKTRPCNI